MSYETLTFSLCRKLESAGIGYMLVGSFASNQYGIPRSTKDADFVIDVATDQIGALYELLEPEWSMDSQVTFEMITGFKKIEIRHPETEFLIELFFLTKDPHHQERWRRRVREFVGDEQFWFPLAEDVIVQKLRWGRAKDLEDVTAVISVQAERLDFTYIEKWCAEHGTLDRLEAIRAKLPSDLGGK